MPKELPLHVMLGLNLTANDQKLVKRKRQRSKYFMRRRLYKIFKALEVEGKLKIHKYTGTTILLREVGKPRIDYDISNDRYLNHEKQRWYNGIDSFKKYYLGVN
jgi:hypothetical protein